MGRRVSAKCISHNQNSAVTLISHLMYGFLLCSGLFLPRNYFRQKQGYFTPMETIVTIPTDEGKSWYVVFLAFCHNFVKESVPYTFLIFVTKKNSELDQQLGFLIGSLYFGTCYIFSPLACALANWYSFTVINIAGPSVILVSMISSHFVSSSSEVHPFLVLTYSLLGGFGCSMIHMSSELMPSYWFCNRRQLAHSLANSGQAFGFLFVPFVAHLLLSGIKSYPISKLFFIFAALVLPLIVLGVLTPKMPGIKVHFNRRSESEKDVPKVRFRDEVEAEHFTESAETFTHSRGYRHFKTYHNLFFPRVKDIVAGNNITLVIPDNAMQIVLMRPFRHGRQGRMSDSSTTMVFGPQKVNLVYRKEDFRYGARPMYRLDIFYSWSLHNVTIYYRQDNQLDYHLGITRAMTRKDLQQEESGKIQCCPEAIIRPLVSMLDWRIVPNAYYIMLQLNIFLLIAGQMVPLIFLTSRAEEAGIDTEPFFLLTYAGLGQIFGRLLITTVGLFYNISSFFNITIFLLCLGGTITILAGFLKSYYNLMIYSILFGIIYGLLQTLRFTVTYTIIQLTNLTNAIGHSLILQAIGSIFAINIAGYLFIQFSVKHVYLFSGGVLIISGILLLFVRLVKNFTFRRLALSV